MFRKMKKLMDFIKNTEIKSKDSKSFKELIELMGFISENPFSNLGEHKKLYFF